MIELAKVLGYPCLSFLAVVTVVVVVVVVVVVALVVVDALLVRRRPRRLDLLSFFLSFFRVLCPDERIGIEFAILFCRKFLVAFVVWLVVFSRRFGSSSFFFFFFYCANLFFSLASPHDTGILQ